MNKGIFKRFIIFALIFLSAAFLLLTGCGNNPPKPLSQESIKSAVSQMKQQKGILGAAIAQKNNTVSLAITVDKGTTKEQAKELGENFARLTITFAEDGKPGKEIGPTKHTYLITITDSSGKIIMQGAKVCGNQNITW